MGGGQIEDREKKMVTNLILGKLFLRTLAPGDLEASEAGCPFSEPHQKRLSIHTLPFSA